MIDYGDMHINPPLPKIKEVKPMTAGHLIKALAKLPEDTEIWASEQGGCYDTKVKALDVPRDRGQGIKKVRIIHGNYGNRGKETY